MISVDIQMSVQRRKKIEKLLLPWESTEDPTIDDVQAELSRLGRDERVVKILNKALGLENKIVVEFEYA